MDRSGKPSRRFWQWRTENPEGRKEWVRAGRRMDNGIKILGWEVKGIWIAGNRAKVRIALRAKTMETLFRWTGCLRGPHPIIAISVDA